MHVHLVQQIEQHSNIHRRWWLIVNEQEKFDEQEKGWMVIRRRFMKLSQFFKT